MTALEIQANDMAPIRSKELLRMKLQMDINGLRQSMMEHVAYRKNSDTVNLLWAGYLAALMVEGHLATNDYHDLNNSLKDVGREELRELFIGYPGQFSKSE
jgi:hypothetical protein